MSLSTRRTAFTLVELVMVIVILGLLAAVVVPKFTDIRSQAVNAAEQGVVSAVRSGINMYHMAQLAQGNDGYPNKLDNATNGVASQTNPLFTEVIDGGVTDSNWKKTGTRTYKYLPTGNRYRYNKNTGKFERI